MQKLSDIIRQRILILDGAMGTMFQRFGLTEQDYRGKRFGDIPGQLKGDNDLLTLTRPDLVVDVHRKYLEAGADIIETNTFSAQRISQADYHCEGICAELNREAARLARRVAEAYSTPEKPRFVAGSVGPTNKMCSMSPDVNDPAYRSLTYDELAEAYAEQIEALLEGGVDALLLETFFDTLNAKAAIDAAVQSMQRTGRTVPLMLSATVADRGGRTLSGQTIEALLTSVMHAPLFSIGLNCSFGAADMKPLIERLAAEAPFYVSAYPNAGLPNALGQYDQGPVEMAREMKTYVDERLVNIIGGCCGTTDRYIAEFEKLVHDADGHYLPPRQPVSRSSHLWLSGLERLEVRPENNFINIGERCNVAGSRRFLRLIKEQRYEDAVGIARRQVEDGAQVLDINMDDGLLDTEREMVHFLRLLAAEPDVARVPFMIDSSKWSVVQAALRSVQGKCIVNSISLKEGETVFLEHAAELKRFGAAVVVMAFDERGQADTYERRIEICDRAYRLLTEKAGLPPTDLIFDPNVLAICTGMAEHDSYALDFIRATAWIRQHLPGAHVSGGVSNLSFAFRGNNYIREAMHAVFLYHAIAAGMDMGIVNPATSVFYSDIPADGLQISDIPADRLQIIEDAILCRRPDAAERLIGLAEQVKDEEARSSQSNAEATDNWRIQSVEERLSYALMKGVTDYLDHDLTEALERYPHAVDLIEGPLMDAMNRVGELFGAGKMFLPQVVKTARTMKHAVTFLQPFIEKEKVAGQTAGKVLLATVKGDVHDIGKNIVGVVLACNGYEVVDLGVMCPAETIVEAVQREKADLIGLSGLITPSLDEMEHTVVALRNAGIRIPVLIGGATTSRLHTALKLVPVYDGPVVWTKDASQVVPVAARLMHPDGVADFMAQLTKENKILCENYMQRNPQMVTLSEARQNKLKLF